MWLPMSGISIASVHSSEVKSGPGLIPGAASPTHNALRATPVPAHLCRIVLLLDQEEFGQLFNSLLKPPQVFFIHPQSGWTKFRWKAEASCWH